MPYTIDTQGLLRLGTDKTTGMLVGRAGIKTSFARSSTVDFTDVIVMGLTFPMGSTVNFTNVTAAGLAINQLNTVLVIASVSTVYTMGSEAVLMVDANTGIDITMPAVVSGNKGRLLHVKRVSGNGKITLHTVNNNVFQNGNTTMTMPSAMFSSVTLYSDGLSTNGGVGYWLVLTNT